MVQDLRNFYDFTGKQVVAVGVGGGRLIGVAHGAKKLIAIDHGMVAIQQLEAAIAAEGLRQKVEVVCADFLASSFSGDVVYFEFSLHEMDDPEQALRHALSMAPEVVIYDHLPGSPWIFHTLDEEKVVRGTSALAKFDCVRHQTFRLEQYFPDHQQLLEKISCHGQLAVARAERFRGRNGIVIPMAYALTLLTAGNQ